ncbi:chemotaxis protein CheW [Fluviispira vulneris]|uniref:chemotaxis protein CheW n=1 Tax=Fluviispira vulneris TaxID=2763012 RepID=UPI0016453C0B|nr:chemotaxis protein CheW [Fluviispira vulneris]
MNNINKLFSNQNTSLTSLKIQNEVSTIEYCTLVKISINNMHYALDIKHVHEIVDAIEIAPYPEKIKNHLGIINIRGKILPVIEIEECKKKKKKDKEKIVAIAFSNNNLFTLKCDKVQKHLYEKNALIPGQIINLNNVPTYFLDEEEFNNLMRSLI